MPAQKYRFYNLVLVSAIIAFGSSLPQAIEASSSSKKLLLANNSVKENPAQTTESPVSLHPSFNTVLAQVEAKTKLAIALPTNIESSAYWILDEVTPSGYGVQFAFTPDCQGQSVCTLGNITAKALTSDAIPPEGDIIPLANGITGYFIDKVKLQVCNGGYCFGIMTWDAEGSRYTLQVKANPEETIRIANSAIQWRLNRQSEHPLKLTGIPKQPYNNLNRPQKLSQAEIDELKSGAGGLENLIPEQVFRVKLKDFGSSTFVPISDSTSGATELSLNLVKYGKIIYTFPTTEADDNWTFFQMLAVAFSDVNKDGFEDTIAISEYVTGIGRTGAQPFPVVTVYFNSGGKSFRVDEKLNEEIAKSGAKTIGDVLAFLKGKFS